MAHSSKRDEDGSHLIQAVDRAARLLIATASSREPPNVRELAELCGLNRSTAYRLLTTLEYHGLVERDPSGLRYEVGHAAFVLAAGARRQQSLIRLARPVMERLCAESMGTVTLSVPESHDRSHPIFHVNPPQMISLNWLDRSLPLHCTSNGKVFLAEMSDAELRHYLAIPLTPYTRKTITDPDAMFREIEHVRRTGVATAIEEYEEGLIGLSAAIRDQADVLVAVISVAGPLFHIKVSDLPKLSPMILEAAEDIRVNLGFKPDDRPSNA